MGNVNMDATQIHNNDKNAPTVQQALDGLKQLSGNLSTLVGELAEDMLDKAEKEDMAPEFDDTETYFTNDIVYHNNQLYIFTANHSVGEWSTEDTQPVNVGNELSSLKNGINELQSGKMDNIHIPMKTRAWGGDTVSYEIAADNTKSYEFKAMVYNDANSYVNAIITIKGDGSVILVNVTNNITASYSDGVLTITLPSSSYWNFGLMKIMSSWG